MRYFFYVSATLMLPLSSLAQFVDYGGELPYVYDDSLEMEYSDFSCEYTPDQQQLLQMVIDMFGQHAESKIVQRLYVDAEMRSLVRTYTTEYIQSLEVALAYCEAGMRDWRAPTNYDEMKHGLVEYVQMLSLLKQFEAVMYSDDQAVYYFDQLRNIVFGDSYQLIDGDTRLSSVLEMSMGLTLKDAWMDTDINLNIISETVAQADLSAMQGAYTLGGTIQMMSDGQNFDTGGEMSVEFRIVDNHMYVRLDDLEVVLGDIEFANQYEAQAFNEILLGAKLIQGKYIDIPLRTDTMMGGAYNPLVMYGSILGDVAAQQDMMREVVKADWMTTYALEGERMYTGLNPIACQSVSEMGAIRDCLMTRQDMYTHTGGKGMMYMEKIGDEMTMGVTDVFAGENMPIELRMMANKSLISRNENEITRVEIPLYDEQDLIGNLSYADGKISADIRIPNDNYDWSTDTYIEQDIHLMMRGSILSDTVQISGSAKDNEFEVLRDILGEGDASDMGFQLQLEFNSLVQDEPFEMSMVLDLDQTQQIVDPVQVQKPPTDQIIGLEELLMY